MKITNKHELVLNFIQQFRDFGTEDCFSHGMCYWFSKILQERFRYEQPVIVYDTIDNHFGCEILGKVYDITGDVTEKYDWEPWNEVVHLDHLWARHVYRDCVDKVPAGTRICGHCDKFYSNTCGDYNYNTICIKNND